MLEGRVHLPRAGCNKRFGNRGVRRLKDEGDDIPQIRGAHWFEQEIQNPVLDRTECCQWSDSRTA